MELQNAIELFLGRYRVTTQNTYKYSLQGMRDYVGATKALSEITYAELQAYANKLNQRGLADATYNKRIKTIKVFFNWCVKKAKFLDDSPAHGLELKKDIIQPDDSRAMPDSVLDKLLNYVQYEPRAHALVLFLADTGCRIGGAAGLQWSDIDFEKLKATVTEKGQPPRPVFFGEACKLALLKWNLKQKRTKGNYVFSFRGNRINNNSLGLYFERQVQHENTGIRGSWGPHSLRHRFGHKCAENGVAPTHTQNLLGHKSIEITLNYYYPRDWETAERKARELHQRSNRIRKLKLS